VFTRRLSVRLLAPTLLVSLALVGACTFSVLHLNSLHVDVATNLSENMRSMLVAGLLEKNTERLIALLRGDHSDPRQLTDEIKGLNQEARTLLQSASDLADKPDEQRHVQDIREGLETYFQQWEKRKRGPDTAAEDAALARHLEENVLAPCKKLHAFNVDQSRKSDHDNQAIVQNLQFGLLAVGLGGPVGGLILGYVVARSLRHSIYQLSVRIRDAAGRLNRDLGSVTLEEEGDFPDLHRQLQGVTEEIERTVEQLQQREREVLRAEQLAAVGQVAAGVAHELRNPLTSVKMLVQTGLEGEAGAGLPPEDLAVIEHEVRRMEQCIKLFLDFARPPASERRTTDLVKVVRRALALVEGRARRQKVQLIAHLPEREVLLKIDPEQVHQVLVNLLLNALDALPHGGTAHVQVEALGKAVEVRVWDNGPGIAPRIRERLFEPFVSSKETGLGLGLSISKRLIEAHGGAIRGENGREGGAVFTFTLPAEEPALAPAPASRVEVLGA
jgi:signal transduction histidine kinase